MKEIISHLKDLNKLDIQLQMLKKDIERLPQELSEKQTVSQNLSGSIERAKAEITRLKMDADGIELEIKSGEGELKRFSTQMNVLRSSKEFEAVKRQMDAQRVWNKENEGKVLEILEQIDVRQTDVDKNNAALEESEMALAVETQRVKKDVSELQVQYDSIAAERAILAKEVPEKELTIYNRITAGRGQAIATVERGNCSLCFMRIPPQIHNMALLARDLVCCPSCGRILTA